MTLPTPTIHPLGESAVTLSWGTTVSPALSASVQAAADTITAAGLPGVVELVPGYAALTVFYDPLHLDYSVLTRRLEALLHDAAVLKAAPAPAPAREHLIPVRYNGPDLDEVARQTGLGRAGVIRHHAERWYRVYLLGFAPGFAYLGELDAALELARRGTPRKRVPAGSVAIAGRQTAVYPLDTPGGWHLIGHTDVTLFDPSRDTPSLLQPGDLVRFEPVT